MIRREALSVFDMFKIGVGPSSSHTLGPWRAALRFRDEMLRSGERVDHVLVALYGSLAKTGAGHKTDVAVQMGLLGEDPETIDPLHIPEVSQRLMQLKKIEFNGFESRFDPIEDIRFIYDQSLPEHPNGMRFLAETAGGGFTKTYFSIGGGFISEPGEPPSNRSQVRLPFPARSANEFLAHCHRNGGRFSDIVRENERAWRSDEEIDAGLDRITREMVACAWRGCGARGILPGGLNVKRRAAEGYARLSPIDRPDHPEHWIDHLRHNTPSFEDTLRWVTCFALAVNEENAAMGRVVTAPTNGAAGVIPAVLLYLAAFKGADRHAVHRFLLTAGELGTLFKKGATISAAMGGCQAEIGVSSAMAAGGLAEVLGATPDQVAMAAEIAMEHHLGLTCDPIAGLVQIPCIERNSMGAIKAIAAASLAMDSDPRDAKVSLDAVILTMWNTAQDMSTKYKETAEGGLAVSVALSEC